MIIVREVFVAKPGMASKMVKLFQDMMTQPGLIRTSRVMTDMTGPFNKVVIETEYDDLAGYERDMQEYMKQASENPQPSKHVDMYIEGRREIYRVW